jgi:DNA-binding transcriptional regulator YhcF (GntR family)
MNRAVTLQVDLSSGAPAYRQIVDGIRLLMVNGELQPGDTLPTVRSLALDLGVHFSTVAEAYRTLSAEGWLELRRHHGAFVTERRSPAPAPEAHADFGIKLRQLIAQVRAEGLSTRVISKELELLARELPQEP